MERKNIIWMDGSVSSQPPGKLLSDNPNYFGDCILTGVTYSYDGDGPTGKGDSADDVADYRGIRLIDGDIICRFRKPVVESEKGVITAVFDFKSDYVFSEVDVLMRTDLESAEWAVSNDGVSFDTVYNASFTEKARPYRMSPEKKANGRYLKLTVKNPEKVGIIQVWVWGDCDNAQDINSQYEENRFAVANSVSLESLMGITNTAYSDVTGFEWTQSIKHVLGDVKVVWSECDLQESISAQPILPTPDVVNKKVFRRVCENGIESVCLALSNVSSTDAVTVTVNVDNETPLKTELYAFGNIETRWYGVVPGPMINEEHRIARPLMFKYLKNAPVIADFPTINLPAGGSCQLWLKIYGNEAKAGKYNVTIRAGETAVEVETEVLPITLGNPKHANLTYGYETEMYPFVWNDRQVVDTTYRMELGANLYHGLPDSGSVRETALKMDPSTIFFDGRPIGEFHAKLYCNAITPEEMASEENYRKLDEYIESYIEKAQKLGLGFDKWYVELPDEPSKKNADAMGVLVRYMKKKYPQVRIYCNPAFWVGFENGAVSDDEQLMRSLESWYPLIDMSLPINWLLYDRPKAYRLFSMNRDYNGQYQVSAQHMRADRPDLFGLAREVVWISLARKMNMWGFFAYHQPALNSWDETKQKETNIYGTINYQCVYAGEFGPVYTRASEYLRDGWQDFRIMDLLDKKNPAIAAEIRQEFLDGCRDYRQMIDKALDALV